MMSRILLCLTSSFTASHQCFGVKLYRCASTRMHQASPLYTGELREMADGSEHLVWLDGFENFPHYCRSASFGKENYCATLDLKGKFHKKQTRGYIKN